MVRRIRAAALDVLTELSKCDVNTALSLSLFLSRCLSLSLSL